MGCASSSSDKPEHVQTGRRRLSVGNVAGGSDELGGDASEEDRGLIQALSENDIMSILGEVGDRKMSIGSTTDACKTSFANKAQEKAGKLLDPAACHLGYTCRKGLKPESPNQDSWFVLKVDGDFSIYAVFDGHGQKGHDVSNFVKDNLPKVIIRDSRFKTSDMPQMLKEAFKTAQSLVSTADRIKKLSAQMSGTTATVVVHDQKEGKLTVAHVADSTAVLGKMKSKQGEAMHARGSTAEEIKKNIVGEPLTRDHKPNLKDERKRIESSGGRVVFDGYANYRIYARNGRYPGLNMSRCIGDLAGHQDCGITAEPEVSEKAIEPEDAVLLVCSDGVWEFILPQEAVEMVAAYEPAKAMQAAEALAKEAWDRWIREEGGAVVDDITVVLVFLNQSSSG